jgi:hypothetical protein
MFSKLAPGTINDATMALLEPLRTVVVQLGVTGVCQSVFTTYTPSIRQSSPGELSAQPRFTTPPHCCPVKYFGKFNKSIVINRIADIHPKNDLN